MQPGNQNPLSVTMSTVAKITANFTTADGKPDLVKNGNFSAGADFWTFNNWAGSSTGNVENGEYKITLNTISDHNYDIQVVQPGIVVQQGKTYRMMFDAYASADRKLLVNVGMPVTPYTSFLTKVNGDYDVNLTTSKQSYSFDFTMEEPTYEDSRIEFSVGSYAPSVFIDNVSLFEINPSSISRSFQNRIAKQMRVSQNGPFVNIAFGADGNGMAFLYVYDLNGNIVYSDKFKGVSGSIQNCSFNTAGMSNGYYIVKIRSGNSIHNTGIVLNRR